MDGNKFNQDGMLYLNEYLDKNPEKLELLSLNSIFFIIIYLVFIFIYSVIDNAIKRQGIRNVMKSLNKCKSLFSFFISNIGEEEANEESEKKKWMKVYDNIKKTCPSLTIGIICCYLLCYIDYALPEY